jgi:Ca2+-binding EF-hand superfamily protein
LKRIPKVFSTVNASGNPEISFKEILGWLECWAAGWY